MIISDILKLFKWLIVGGFALGVISLILFFLPDPSLNNLGEGFKALAQVISDLPHMLSIFVYLLAGILLFVAIVKIGARD